MTDTDLAPGPGLMTDDILATRHLVRRRIRQAIDVKAGALDVRELTLLLALDVQLALDLYEAEGTPRVAKVIATIHMLTVGILKDGGHAAEPERVGAAWTEYLDRLDGQTPQVRVVGLPPAALTDVADRAVPAVLKRAEALERDVSDAMDKALAKREAARAAGKP